MNEQNQDVLDIGEYVKIATKKIEEFKKTKVRCAIIGRSGTGKSSLINAIIGKDVLDTGPVETTMEVSEPIEHGGLIFYDLPGCSTQKFPRSKYFERFKIKNFDCVIVATSDRFTEDDHFLVNELISAKVPVYAIRTKIDISVDDELKKKNKPEVETLNLIRNDLIQNLKGYSVQGIYLTSADYPLRYDLDKLLKDIYNKLTSHKRRRFIADVNITSKFILDEKRKTADSVVAWYSAAAAANGLNPIPGLDISVDAGILVKLGHELERIYGLDNLNDTFLSKHLEGNIGLQLLGKASQFASKYLGKEAILLLLKRAGVNIAAKSASKFIPILGYLVAAGIGYKITKSVGDEMVKDASGLAQEVFNAIKKEY